MSFLVCAFAKTLGPLAGNHGDMAALKWSRTYDIVDRVRVSDIGLGVDRLFAWNLDWFRDRAVWFIRFLVVDASDFDADVDDTATFAQERRAPLLILTTVVGDLEVNVVEQIVGALLVELWL